MYIFTSGRSAGEASVITGYVQDVAIYITAVLFLAFGVKIDADGEELYHTAPWGVLEQVKDLLGRRGGFLAEIFKYGALLVVDRGVGSFLTATAVFSCQV